VLSQSAVPVSGNIWAKRPGAAEEGGGDGNSSPGAAPATANDVVAHKASALNKIQQHPIEPVRGFLG